MLDVVIDRTKWARGEPSSLRDDRTKMQCCLGFACRAAGVTKKRITGQGVIDDIIDDKGLRENLPGLITKDGPGWMTNSIHDELVMANDSFGLDYKNITDDREREDLITKLGKEAGINFSFVN